MDVFSFASGMAAAVMIPYDTYITNRPRAISTFENDGVVYTLEVSPVFNFAGWTVLPHTHKLRMVTPDTPRKNALVYFTVDSASLFESLPVAFIHQWGVHNHRCKLWENCKDKVYYIGNDHQIYEHSTEQSYSYMPNYLCHTHTIKVLDIHNSKTNSATQSAQNKGPGK
jgi:hypothetical protein